MPTHFLNVDLDIRSVYDLQPLVSALGKKVCVLHVGRIKKTYEAHLELARMGRTPDATIRALCSLIEGLPAAHRELWDSATRRQFNIGVQAGGEPHATELGLAAGMLKRVCGLDAEIALTVYAPESTG